MHNKIKIYYFKYKPDAEIPVRDIKAFAKIQSDFSSDMEETVGFSFQNQWVLNPWVDRDGARLKTKEAKALYGKDNVNKFIADARKYMNVCCKLIIPRRGCGRNPGPNEVINRRRSRTCIPTKND